MERETDIDKERGSEIRHRWREMELESKGGKGEKSGRMNQDHSLWWGLAFTSFLSTECTSDLWIVQMVKNAHTNNARC